ncbi:macrophage mannose receptor 1-like [Acipenser oxyrinchus oxyrinchus]|uniref:Macrophage mannose receptor 1-like n=1 Tax=Acipenser oxyrinchus oxyrinchus TaxID=40147 RepID=A0AAD8CEA8_ACIOX|nr:macrophage mannose receptor 1-like [Acipenser oxyrinchus oxyrinchus]
MEKSLVVIFLLAGRTLFTWLTSLLYGKSLCRVRPGVSNPGPIIPGHFKTGQVFQPTSLTQLPCNVAEADTLGSFKKLLGLCEDASCHNRTYIPVKTLKSWTDARSYCREMHTDLVTVHSLEEQQQILNVAKDDQFWIGLYRDSDNWEWSTGDVVSYTNWTAATGGLFCATADAGGSWDQLACHGQKPFMCYNETSNIAERYTPISTLNTWAEAQQYCRQHHTDLVIIKSASENEDMKMKAPASPFWIGLFNNPWKWADEENATFQNWNIGQPDSGNAKCVLMYSPNQGKWEDWPYDDWKYFVCYEGKDLCSFWLL